MRLCHRVFPCLHPPCNKLCRKIDNLQEYHRCTPSPNLATIDLRLSRCESKEAPCCLSTVGFIPALTRTGQAPFSASGGPTPADEASFSHAYSPFVVAAYCCPSGFGMPGVSRPLPPVGPAGAFKQKPTVSPA